MAQKKFQKCIDVYNVGGNMQNFNHSNGNNKFDKDGQNKGNQDNSHQSSRSSLKNSAERNQTQGFFSNIVNWGVSLASKYGKTFEIVVWALTIIGILFIPILAVAMTYFAYCYSKINPTRGHVMMAVALIGGIVSWVFFGGSNDNTSDGEVWYYFWTE